MTSPSPAADGSSPKQQKFDGPDRMKPVMLNRYDWYSAHNWSVAYPGDPRIYRPDQVPGRSLPAAFLGGE